MRRVVTVRGMSYPSDLTDEQWELLEAVFIGPGRRGRKHADDLRSVVEATLYISQMGCPWRYPPASFGPCTRVWGHRVSLRRRVLGFTRMSLAMGADLRRGVVLEAAIARARPPGQFWYLAQLGASRPGKSAGSALLEHRLSKIDDAPGKSDLRVATGPPTWRAAPS